MKNTFIQNVTKVIEEKLTCKDEGHLHFFFAFYIRALKIETMILHKLFFVRCYIFIIRRLGYIESSLRRHRVDEYSLTLLFPLISCIILENVFNFLPGEERFARCLCIKTPKTVLPVTFLKNSYA